ncbi:MAG: hypothetical protein HQL84_02625 [Magnetococcales bacterium]|nr:hypothetical protein [Magnetococcales bacterium]MBF0148920.1 hypothetical protein [Magnetococcales bacterium]MBF0347591.1 hypothetical protein [Magnetococcales bacterium]MBF0630119.1 hypothetical protein [Magnetococcales bacterium]
MTPKNTDSMEKTKLPDRTDRRAFLLAGLGIATTAVVVMPSSPGNFAARPVERSLKEADFYRPHDRAG